MTNLPPPNNPGSSPSQPPEYQPPSYEPPMQPYPDYGTPEYQPPGGYQQQPSPAPIPTTSTGSSGGSKTPMIIGGVVVLALIAGLIYFLTKGDDKDSAANQAKSCENVSASVQAMRDARTDANDLDPQGDEDLPEAKKAINKILDDGALATMSELRPVVESVKTSKNASDDAKDQADEYLDQMAEAESTAKQLVKEINGAKTLDELVKIISNDPTGDKPLSLEQSKYSELSSALQDLGDECSTMVDDLNSSSD